MVQQTDSKFSEYVLANSESGFPKHDKTTTLRDFQDENTTMVPESDGNSLLKDDGPVVENLKVAGIKRQQQTPASNNGHLVYVRRKTEAEQRKNSTCNNTNTEARKLHENDVKNQELTMNSSTIDVRKEIPEPKTTSDGLSGKSPVANSSCLQLNHANGLSIQHWQERYITLQNFLKALDLSNQDDYCRMLHSLSSVGLSRVAVELEKRSIQLSMEEAREVQRAKLVNLLDKYPISAGEHQSMK